MSNVSPQMKHVRSPALGIRGPVPADQLPRIAIAGAAQHLQYITRIVSAAVIEWEKTGDFESPTGLPLNPNDFSMHIRSFFWEVFAANDMVLQWVNEVLALGLDPGQVRWKDFRLQTKKKKDEHHQLWDRVLTLITAYRESADFFELSEYRHYSHENFVACRTLLSRDKKLSLVAIEPVRVGQAIEDVRDQLPRYLTSVAEHTKSVAELIQSASAAA